MTELTSCTNAELGATLRLSHSTVSRMRSGRRMGSIETIERIAAVSRTPIAEVIEARKQCLEGDLTNWNRILDLVCAHADDE